jgi:hypothetical protein
MEYNHSSENGSVMCRLSHRLPIERELGEAAVPTCYRKLSEQEKYIK